MQDAARAAALEVLREVQQQGNLGNLGNSPPPTNRPEQNLPSSTQSSSGNGVPKGYKGDPSDTRADAFRKMQVRLHDSVLCLSEVRGVLQFSWQIHPLRLALFSCALQVDHCGHSQSTLIPSKLRLCISYAQDGLSSTSCALCRGC